MEENLIAALKESISNSQRIKSLILHNIEATDKKVIRLNLVYLTFDFHPKPFC